MNLFMIMALLTMVVILVLNILFFLASMKQEWEVSSSSSFECGFSSYFFSHYSFSIHYYMVALIFLFLDLELCIIMPLINSSSLNFWSLNLLFFMVFILLGGLLWEWLKSKLEWVF